MAGVALCADQFIALRDEVMWRLTLAAYAISGSFCMLFALKALGDPFFSEWLAPGPGNPLLGDAGNFLVFEAGPTGVYSKILGVQANLVEGVILGIASLSLVTCWSAAPAAQLLTAVVAPIGGAYLLVSSLYFRLTHAPEMAPTMLLLGTALVAASIYRMHSCHPDSRALFPAYLAYLACLAVAAAGSSLWIYRRVPRFRNDVIMLARVRHHFLEVNGMRWSAGSRHPDGFVPEPQSWMQRIFGWWSAST